MKIIGVNLNNVTAAQVQLPDSNMTVDPRAIHVDRYGRTFKCHVEDKTLTVTQTDTYRGVPAGDMPPHVTFRAYNSKTETVPDFTSNKYTYMGIEGEMAPYDTKESIVHPSVRTIRFGAFRCCRNMVKCTMMEDNVTHIESGAFGYCVSLRYVRLSRTLRYVGPFAFSDCYSLEALFLPPTVEKIESGAFRNCCRIRVLPMPYDIDLEQNVGSHIVKGCDALLNIGAPVYHEFDKGGRCGDRLCNLVEYKCSLMDDDKVNYWLKHRHDKEPFHRICESTSVTVDAIESFIQQHGTASAFRTDEFDLTPLHVLVMNPHADMGAVVTCFNINPIAAFSRDCKKLDVIDYLSSFDMQNLVSYLIQSLCIDWRTAGKSMHTKRSHPCVRIE